MKQILFKDPNNEKQWNDFEQAVKELADKHQVSLLSDGSKNKVLIILEWPSSRGFDGIKESFVIDKSLWPEFKDIIQSGEIYFGEIAGKHSEIYGNLDDDDIKEVDLETLVEKFLKENGNHKRDKHSFLDTLLYKFEENNYKEFERFNEIYNTFKK